MKLMSLNYEKEKRKKIVYGFGSWFDRFLGILSTNSVRPGSFFCPAQSSSAFSMKTNSLGPGKRVTGAVA